MAKAESPWGYHSTDNIMFKFIKNFFYKIKMRKLIKKRLEEIRKQDPFIYK